MKSQLLALVFGLCIAGPALPQQRPIEEIVVTGEFRDARINQLPTSLSVITERQIKARNAQHLEELLGMAPNVNFASGASRGRFYQIRGIGERGQFSEPLNASVGLLIDNVDLSGAGTVGTLYDVGQVEIFRGPQGTLYGANALAGLVNITSNVPAKEFEAGARMEAGNYSTYSLGGYLSGPATETFGYRLALQQYRSDGWVDNDFLNKDDTNDLEETTARGRLRWQPSRQTTLDLIGGYIDVDNGYDGFSLDNVRDTLSDNPGHDKQETKYLSLDARFEQAGAFNVESFVSYADSDIDYGYDEDWVFEGFHPFGYDSTDRYLRDRQTTTAEVRLVSKDDGRLFRDSTDWVVGLYGLNQQVDLTRQYTYLVDDFSSDYEVDRLALFGQTETYIGPVTTLTLGLRVERHESTYDDNEGVSFDPDDDLWGGRVGIDHLINVNTLIYGSVSRGYKSGGFNTDGSLDAFLREFDPETAYNFEVGAKGAWLEDTLTGRLSLFYMLRDEMQVSTSVQLARPDGSTEFVDYIGNASDGDNYGLEAEFLWQPNERWELLGTLGLLETEYDDYVNGSGEILDGRDQAHAPSYQFFVSVERFFPGGWFVRGEVEGKDAFYFSDSHDEKSDAHELFNFSAGIAQQNWSAVVWVKNATDEDTLVRGFFFGNDPRVDYEGRGYTQLGEPRRYGVTLEVFF